MSDRVKKDWDWIHRALCAHYGLADEVADDRIGAFTDAIVEQEQALAADLPPEGYEPHWVVEYVGGWMAANEGDEGAQLIYVPTQAATPEGGGDARL